MVVSEKKVSPTAFSAFFFKFIGVSLSVSHVRLVGAAYDVGGKCVEPPPEGAFVRGGSGRAAAALVYLPR